MSKGLAPAHPAASPFSRQPDLELRSPLPVHRGDRASVTFHDRFHDGEAQARVPTVAPRRGRAIGEEAIEDPHAVRLGDAWSLVGNSSGDGTALDEGGDRNRAAGRRQTPGVVHDGLEDPDWPNL